MKTTPIPVEFGLWPLSQFLSGPRPKCRSCHTSILFCVEGRIIEGVYLSFLLPRGMVEVLSCLSSQRRCVAAPCYPSGREISGALVQCCGVGKGHVESPPYSKGALRKGDITEVVAAWQIMKSASTQAGNRTGKMARRAQWWDRGLECPARAQQHRQQSVRLLIAFSPFHLTNI